MNILRKVVLAVLASVSLSVFAQADGRPLELSPELTKQIVASVAEVDKSVLSEPVVVKAESFTNARGTFVSGRATVIVGERSHLVKLHLSQEGERKVLFFDPPVNNVEQCG